MSRRERRELQRRLREAEWTIWDMEIKFSENAKRYGKAFYPWGREKKRKLVNLIEQYDSRVLEKQAERFGIEIPVRPDWFSTEIKPANADTLDSRDTIDRWLNETGRTMITKQVRDARFAYWKGWAEILVPILALIVAIIALLKK
jgi:hypothetical protein